MRADALVESCLSVLAVEVSTGKVLWTMKHDGWKPPTESKDGIFYLYAGQELQLIETATGVPRWRIPLDENTRFRGLVKLD